jgi:hypothetical protein
MPPVLYAESGQDAAALALADTLLAQNPITSSGTSCAAKWPIVAGMPPRGRGAQGFHGPLPGRDRPGRPPEYGEHKPVIDEYRTA